jgi:uncharacterized protein YjiS (DUF1127 family)
MDNYALHQAQFAGGSTDEGILVRYYHNWQSRRAVSKLTELNDHYLKDIGLTPSDVRWAASQPLNVNATLALEECARQRLTR